MSGEFDLLEGTDPWLVLRLPRDADAEEIREAYRRISRRAHPDQGGDGKWMAQVNLAREILSNPARLAAYRAAVERRAPEPEQVGPEEVEPESPPDRFEWASGAGPAPGYLRDGDAPAEPDVFYVADEPAGPVARRIRSWRRWIVAGFGGRDHFRARLSWLAIASLPATFLWVPIGVFLAIVAVARSRGTGQRGLLWAWVAILAGMLLTLYR